jgi:hypothetical protein
MTHAELRESGVGHGLIRIDEELIAAAIYEARTVSFASDACGTMEQSADSPANRPLLLMILLELMVPGLNAAMVWAMVHQLIVTPAMTKLLKVGEDRT